MDIDKITNENIIIDNSGRAPFIKLKGMDRFTGIRHGFSTRLGGVSKGIYESMNLGLKLDDEKENVLRNYEIFGESVGIDHTRISSPDQVHKAKVLVATEEDAGDGIVRPLTHFEVDAQVTNVKNLPLIVFGADCVPMIFYDPVHEAIGTAHGGWRGTVMRIAGNVIKTMKEEYGSDPGDIHVGIGPSIGPGNYEVDDTVIREVSKMNLPGAETAYRLRKTKYMLDLWLLNRLVLIEAGVPDEHIYCAELCTMKHHDTFFSHRYTHGRRGLNAGIICINLPQGQTPW